jgi:hypothetical protein
MATAAVAVLLVIALVVARRRRRSDNFMPVPELTCGGAPAPEYAVDVTGRGAVGTVVWEPFTSSRENFMAASVPDKALGSDATDDKALAMLAKISSRVGLGPRGYSPRTASCASSVTDLDADLNSAGISDSAIMCERMVSRGSAQRAAGSGTDDPPYGVGLGSVYQDPRFQPGPEARLADDGGAPASGRSAAGPLAAPLVPAKFLNDGAWDAKYVREYRGYGPGSDMRSHPLATLVTL